MLLFKVEVFTVVKRANEIIVLLVDFFLDSFKYLQVLLFASSLCFVRSEFFSNRHWMEDLYLFVVLLVLVLLFEVFQVLFVAVTILHFVSILMGVVVYFGIVTLVLARRKPSVVIVLNFGWLQLMIHRVSFVVLHVSRLSALSSMEARLVLRLVWLLLQDDLMLIRSVMVHTTTLAIRSVVGVLIHELLWLVNLLCVWLSIQTLVVVVIDNVVVFFFSMLRHVCDMMLDGVHRSSLRVEINHSWVLFFMMMVFVFMAVIMLVIVI